MGKQTKNVIEIEELETDRVGINRRTRVKQQNQDFPKDYKGRMNEYYQQETLKKDPPVQKRISKEKGSLKKKKEKNSKGKSLEKSPEMKLRKNAKSNDTMDLASVS